MNFISKYERVADNKNHSGFVGMNSGKGFVSIFDEIINERDLKKNYVIKGAPGTGKSTFMKTLSDKAELLGHKVQKYLCSSDYTSLDAIVIDSKVAVLDGTPPHSYEPKYPGAVSEIIDYTKFWDNSKLEKMKNDIIYYSSKKSVAYDKAYSKLKCEMNLINERINSIKQCLSFEKMKAHIGRLITSFGKINDAGEIYRIITRSVGMKGRVMLDNLYRKSEMTVKISDVYGSAYIYMAELVRELEQLKIEIYVSPDPVCPNMICDLIIPSKNILITVEDINTYDKNINMMRFIDNSLLSDIRGFIRLSDKCSKLFAEETDHYLSCAGENHFELEKIYGDAMNFDFLKTYSEMKTYEILEYLK